MRIRGNSQLVRVALILTLVVGQLAFLTPGVAEAAYRTDLVAPPGSEMFGMQVLTLPNGNIVVTDPRYDEGATADVGAVYLYDGATLSLISVLKGSTANDQVGFPGVQQISNDKFLIFSGNWDNGVATDAGAVTQCDATTGCAGIVSAANSLVGSSAGDRVGTILAVFPDVMPLSNGNYVIVSPAWSNGAATAAGAVTWVDGTLGLTGTVSAANSLVGTSTDDRVGLSASIIEPGVIPLSNGNYVVLSPNWSNGAAASVGAVTWGSGTTGIIGPVTTANSLVGTTSGDAVGSRGIAELSTNSNYLVLSPGWDDGAVADVGAVTWADGDTGITGEVTVTNSLVGSATNEQVGSVDVALLTNGNYVVRDDAWNDNRGAATWGNGLTGITGIVTSTNSLVGGTAGDGFNASGITALRNGNYVVANAWWDNGAIVDAGAVTWCNGATGCVDVVSAANSLVGSNANDRVGYAGSPVALTNGNYVVRSENWSEFKGAVTWGDGDTGITGTVSADNSLVGSTNLDYVGSGDIWALSNGNYVVASPNWSTGLAGHTGAVTWSDGTRGITGTVSVDNSLVGDHWGDHIGINVTVLTNGNYVTSSGDWDDGTTTDVGAATWGNGTTGITGTVSAANSLIGSSAGDEIGGSSVVALQNGNYVVGSMHWTNGGTGTYVGAMTWGDGSAGSIGTVSAANSLVGSASNDQVGGYSAQPLSNGNYMIFALNYDGGAGAAALGAGWANTPHGSLTSDNSVLATGASGENINCAYDPVYDRLVVGRPGENIVTIFQMPHTSINTGDWTQAANWDYGTPGTHSSAIVTDTHTINLTAPTAIKHVSIGPDATLDVAANHTFTLTGDFVNAGTFMPASGSVVFGGGMTQSLTTTVPTVFNNFTVYTGTLLVEQISADNANVNGTLTNWGTIRKSQPVTGLVTRTFGLAGALAGGQLAISLTMNSGLTALQVDRFDRTYVHTTGSPGNGVGWGRYWAITNTGEGFSATVTLPHDISTPGDAMACRYSGAGATGWECRQDAVTANTVTFDGVDHFSDWAVGDTVGPTSITLDRLSAAPRTSDAWWLLLLSTALVVIGGSWLTQRAKRR